MSIREQGATLLADGWREKLAPRVDAAVERATRSQSNALLAIAVPLAGELDPTAWAYAARRGEEHLFSFDQRERGFSLAALGIARRLSSVGADRFERLARNFEQLVSETDVVEVVNAGEFAAPLAVGGFGFSERPQRSHRWREFSDATLVVPDIAVIREGNITEVHLAIEVEPGEHASGVLDRVDRRVAELVVASLPLLDPDPAVPVTVASVVSPQQYEASVAAAVARIRAGELDKVVLSRELSAHSATPFDAGATISVLRELFPSCFVFSVSYGQTSFLAASPELLVRVQGQRASTVALAGSARRSIDPAVDDHLGEGLLRSEKDLEEHQIVVDYIQRILEAKALWVAASEEPAVIKIANIQHLATAIRAQLENPILAIELAGHLHPTPAVGGEPLLRAKQVIGELEATDRGWYTGAVGWMDASGSGEFSVALRCTLLDGNDAYCFAGVGVVADSDPATELAETETKLEAILPLLAP